MADQQITIVQRPIQRVIIRDGAAARIITGNPIARVRIVQAGAPGRDGGGASLEVSAVVDVDVVAGMPLAVSRINSHLLVAAANYKPTAFVAGLARAATAAGFVATAARDKLTLPDWTAITGTAQLASGQTYFLGADGGLTTTPPPPPDCVTIVGYAASPSTLSIDPQPPLQL